MRSWAVGFPPALAALEGRGGVRVYQGSAQGAEQPSMARLTALDSKPSSAGHVNSELRKAEETLEYEYRVY